MISILTRAVFREIAASAILGTVLFTFILFLQRLGKLFEQLVRGAANAETVAYLSGLNFIPTLTFAVPVGVLVGVLIALSRLSGDNEITAIRASGVSARMLLKPVMAFAFLGFAIAAASSLWLTPWSIRETYRLMNQLAAVQLTAEIQAQVFDEQFPNTILYVRDVVPGPVVRWRKVFLADTTPPDQRKSNAREQTQGPLVTFAEEAIAIPDVANNRIQLALKDSSTHELGANQASDYNSFAPQRDLALEAQKRSEFRSKAYIEIDTAPLSKIAYAPGPPNAEARIELHQRFALPVACLLFALVGLPLGVSQRKAGRSFAFVVTVFLAFLYYMGYISLIGLARQGTLPAELAVWLPDALFLVFGLGLLVRLEAPGDFDVAARLQRWWQDVTGRVGAFFGRRGEERDASVPASSRRHWGFLPQVLDTYVLNGFVFWFVLLLVSFVMIIQIFTFFELLSDIVKRHTPMTRVFTMLWNLNPEFIYRLSPLSVLAAVLVTFGVMSKNNEVTAFKACGVSLYRLAMPVLFVSLMLSAALFAFDYYYVPEANRRQDAIRNEIKGKPPQSFYRPDRKYVYGQGSRIFYYTYFDPVENVMAGVSVYEIDPKLFRLVSVITAERARWEPGLKQWVFQNGVYRAFKGVRVETFEDFRGSVRTFTHLNEPPGYFARENKLSIQMNYKELDNKVKELQQSGFDTTQLQVQYHGKFATPLFAFIMALISIPFAFLTGSRGAMAGVGVSLGVAIAYLTLSKLCEQLGYVNLLPPAMAAWSPGAVFSMAGLYLFLRIRT